MSDENNDKKNDGSSALVVAVATNVVWDGCIGVGMAIGGPVGAGIGWGIGAALVALGIGAAIRGGSTK